MINAEKTDKCLAMANPHCAGSAALNEDDPGAFSILYVTYVTALVKTVTTTMPWVGYCSCPLLLQLGPSQSENYLNQFYSNGRA